MNISFDTEIYEVSFLHFYEFSENTGEGDEFLISCPPVASQQGVFFIFLVPFFFFFGQEYSWSFFHSFYCLSKKSCNRKQKKKNENEWKAKDSQNDVESMTSFRKQIRICDIIILYLFCFL